MPSILDRILGRKPAAETKAAQEKVAEDAARSRREELAKKQAEADAARKRFEETDVKSVNERDPRCQLQSRFSNCEHSDRTATAKVEEGVGNGRSVWPGYPRLHAAYNGQDNAMQHRKVKLIA